MYPLDILTIVLVGLSLASFISSLSYRVQRKISIVRPPSFCPNCKERLKPFELIPVLSYMILRGRCRYCGYKIPVKYFLIELLFPLIYLGIYRKFGFTIPFFLYSYIFTVLAYLSLLDIDTGRIGIFDILMVYTGCLSLIFFALTGRLYYKTTYYLYGFLSALTLISLSFLIIYLIKRRIPMGSGDLIVIPGVALFFGMREVFRILIFSSLSGIFLGAILILTGLVKRNYKFPMIPYLTAGVVIEVLFF